MGNYHISNFAVNFMKYLTDFSACVGNHFSCYTWQSRHISVMASQITGNSTVCSQLLHVYMKTSNLSITGPLWNRTGKLPVAMQWLPLTQYNDVIMSAMTSHITGISIVGSTVCSDADQRKHQSSVSLALVRGIDRWPVVPLTKD